MSLRHEDRDLFGDHRRIVRYVKPIAEDELQRVPARRQLQVYFRLTPAEVTMVFVGRDRSVECRHVCIDQQVMMTRSAHVDARRSDTHTL